MKIFYIPIVLAILFGSISAFADVAPKTCSLCKAYNDAHLRGPRPSSAELVCVNFTLPDPPPKEGNHVVLKVMHGDTHVIDDAKTVTVREGQFCYPKTYWQRIGEPDAVFLCSEHRVTVRGNKVLYILSGRGTKSQGYACLRGVAGCGDNNHSVLLADELDK
jgi:hypothetical protein